MTEKELKSIVDEIELKDLFDQASDLIHFALPDGTILYINQAWKSSLGYDNSDVINKSLYSIVHPDDRERFRAERNEIIKNHLSRKLVEARFITKKGEIISIEGYIICKYENSVAQYTHAILRDVTKRKVEELKLQQVNEDLKEREENFNRLINEAPDGIIVINELSRIILWNKKSEEIFGWTAEEVKGLELGETIIPPQHRKSHYEGLKRYLTTGELRVLNKTIEITALNKNKEEFFIALTISRATSKGQTAFIAFIRDIRHEKKMQEELRMQKQKLEQSNEELGQYASLASHDLKEPLRKILIFSDRVLNLPSSEIDQASRESLNKIHSAAERMSALITGISRFKNISLNEEELTKVDVQTVIENVKWDLDLMVKEKDATIVVEEIPSVNAVPIHVHQLIQNLISNSIKYSKPDEPPFITITGKPGINGFVEISVEDNGIGFDNKYAGKAFQAFQRLHGSKYEGTGIGLSIAKKIVEIYGGSIWVDSEPGKGSTFTFTLPG
jgi:two-component system sensor kinase FixL